jgi:hypothetical protein
MIRVRILERWSSFTARMFYLQILALKGRKFPGRSLSQLAGILHS